MDGYRLLKSLKLKNFLSFGDPGVELELEPLNVLIGANGCGKSNFVEGVRLIAATPSGLTEAMRPSGRGGFWAWQGGDGPFEIEAVSLPDALWPDDMGCNGGNEYLHTASLLWSGVGPSFEREQMTVTWTSGAATGSAAVFDRTLADTEVMVSDTAGAGLHRSISRQTATYKTRELQHDQSILQQLRDPNRFAELYPPAGAYNNVRVQGHWPLGRRAPARRPQLADLRSDFLDEDAANLALVINGFERFPQAMDRLQDGLRHFLPDAEKVVCLTRAGTVELFVRVRGMDQLLPATRLSDGSLRWLCLLTILCDPGRGHVYCLEEPELGLHPDAIAVLAELLLEASQRNQFIITTHSDALVSALSDTPEAVVVCERDEMGTSMRRVNREALGEWLEEYQLGDLWRSGHLGGNP